jgi:hypothetical protein
MIRRVVGAGCVERNSVRRDAPSSTLISFYIITPAVACNPPEMNRQRTKLKGTQLVYLSESFCFPDVTAVAFFIPLNL